MPSLAAVAHVTIQFIGIIMFNQEKGVRAILPRIPDQVVTGKIAEAQPTGIQLTSLQAQQSAQKPDAIEPHTAFIAFLEQDVIYDGWQRKTLDSGTVDNSAYSYVLLNNDHVIFDTLGVTNNVIVPTNKPRDLGLGKLSFGKGVKPSLNDRFQPPDYAGAAGVIEIPAGEIQACKAAVKGMDGITRTDTTLGLNMNGLLVVRTTDGSKYIVLRPTATIYVANAPWPWVTNHMHVAGNYTYEHWKAYYLMTTQPGSDIAPAEPGWSSPGCDAAQ